MKHSRQRKSVDLNSSADDYQAEDLAAISRTYRSGASDRTSGRKAFQLCRQVSETLNGLLSGECRDDVLQSLYVESVTPAHDATQLLVVVGLLDSSVLVSEGEILEKLRRASNWLRAEVAAAITRRKAPQLVFQFQPRVVAAAEGPSGEVPS